MRTVPRTQLPLDILLSERSLWSSEALCTRKPKMEPPEKLAWLPKLPDQVLVLIIRSLPPKDRASLAKSCKLLNEIATNAHVFSGLTFSVSAVEGFDVTVPARLHIGQSVRVTGRAERVAQAVAQFAHAADTAKNDANTTNAPDRPVCSLTLFPQPCPFIILCSRFSVLFGSHSAYGLSGCACFASPWKPS